MPVPHALGGGGGVRARHPVGHAFQYCRLEILADSNTQYLLHLPSGATVLPSQEGEYQGRLSVRSERR